MKLTANIQGGLGNQLFIIFTSIAYCIKYGIQYEFVRRDISPSCTYRITYWNTILKKIPTVNSLSFSPEIVYDDIDENTFNEIPDLRKHHKNILLNGYFQSHRYFDRILPIILKSVNSLDKNDAELVNATLTMLKIKAKGSPLIFLHIRHGDYYIYSNILELSYYYEAIKYFESNAHFVIFSDDIQYCKNNFSNIKNVSFIEDKDYIELLLMSKMDGAIIANSTFSWWGAYLMDPQKNKTVIAPRNWKKEHLIQNDRYLPHWLVL